MNIGKLLEFVQSLGQRTVKNPNTTVGGGVFGIVAAAVFAKVEEMSGCNFASAFANIDYGQLFVFGISQVLGATMTDANKTIVKSVTPNG